MKKALLTITLSAASLLAGAQVVEVQSIEKVPVQQDLMVNIARVSPDGTFAIVSNHADNSLSRVDFRTGAVRRVAESGSALQLAFTPEGDNIVFKNATLNGRLRYYSIETVELSSGLHRQLARPARKSAAFQLAPTGTLSLNAEGRFSARSIKDQAVVGVPQAIVNINRGHLEVTLPGGEPRNIDPLGKGSYLWPSLSPDGTKIVFYLSLHGCYVCNLDGSDVRSLGYIHAPRWVNDQVVVGQQDFDDGATLLSSAIVVSDLQGVMQTIVPGDRYAFNPSASADGKTITFSTFDGELYVITLK